MSQYYLGIDVGSTTVKAYLTDEKDVCLFSRYVRHNSDVRNTILTLLEEIHQEYQESIFIQLLQDQEDCQFLNH